MRNNSPLNFNCDFAPEIVDFIYGEIGDERKKIFTNHLVNCSDCADEVAEFSGIRFAIKDWKTAEFDKLATPHIQIPYQMPVATVANENNISWLDSVRGFFKLSPVMSGAMAVLLLGLMVGLGFFILGRNTNQLLAGTNTKNQINLKPSLSPEKTVGVEKQDVAETRETNPNRDSAEIPKAENKIGDKEIKPVEAKKVETTQKIQPLKTNVKIPVANVPLKNNDAKILPNRKKPRLTELPEETEDDGLRLADLFAELDTK